MALIAHWPLNGNTNDISGNKWNGNLMGSPTYTNGKIGQAISLNGSTQYVDVPTREYLKWRGQEFSVFLWVNLASDDSDGSIISKPWNGSGQYNYRIYNGSNNIGVYLLGSQSYSISTSAGSITKGVWNHIGFTVNSTTLRIYINGAKVSEAAHGITSWIPSVGDGAESLAIGTLYPYGTFNQPTHAAKGLYNDVRIYDHALTDMEIQELARAKILHYTFDDMQEPTTNIIASDFDTTFESFSDGTNPSFYNQLGTGNYIGVNSTRGYYSQKSLRVNRGTGGTRIYRTKNVALGDYICVSSMVYSTVAGPYFTIEYFGGDYNWSVYHIRNTHTGSGWEKLYAYVPSSASSATTLYYFFYPAVDNTDTFIDNIQIEKKSYYTDYVNGSRTARVNDHSGFFNHSVPLTEANTPRWTPEAKIGTGAYKLNGNNYFLIHKYNASNDASLSLWFKSNLPTSASQIVIGSPSSISFGIHNNTIIGMATTSAPVGLLSGSPYTVGQWNHIVITRDSSNAMSYYINGIKISNGSDNNWSWNDDPYGIIGRRTLGYAGSAYYTNGEIDDIRVYSTTLSEKDIKDLYEARAEIEQSGVLYARDFLSNAEETVNLITNKLDSWPSFGMGHRTYSADSAGTYNNGTAYSIGNIISVTNNILTVDGTGKVLYTYDCIYPTTTGGGLNSGTEYFIKKHGTNQYSFHTYNGNDDGNQTYINSETGKFHVHYSVDTDTRIAINLTDFPTQWRGNPHKANQSMVKQVIPNGFNYRGRVHDCVRIVTSHRHPDPINSYMAYGVYPQVTAGKYYTFSFYIRAINDAAIGKNIQMTLWTSGSWSGGTYGYAMPITKEWKRYVMHALAPNTGGTNMYFPGINSGGDAEIAEIQCEEGIKVTEFTTTYRPASQLPSTIQFGANEVHETGTANFEDFSTVGITDGLVGYWQFDKDVKDYSGNNYNGTVVGSVPILDDSTYFNGAVTNYIQLPNSTITNLGDFTFSFFAKFTNISKAINTIFHATNTGGNDLSLEFYGNMVIPVLNSGSYFSYNTTNLNNVWYHFIVKRTGSTIEVIKDNISLGINTYPTTVYSITGAIILGHEQDAVGGGFDATQSFEGYLSNFKLFNRALTAEEIAIEYNTIFNNEVQIHESGVLYAKDIKQY